MVSAVKVKSYLEPLLVQYDDLALVGRLLVVKPVQHVLRAVIIDRTSSANRIQPRWYVYNLFDPRCEAHLSWGEDLSSRRGYLWDTDDPSMPDVLRASIKTIALPTLRPIQTLSNFSEFVLDKFEGHHLLNDPFKRIGFDLAMGRVSEATELCTKVVCSFPDAGTKEADVTKSTIEGAKLLCSLLREGDVTGGIRLLHEWEYQTIKALKIAHLWERTPFPVEEKFGLV